MHFPSSTLKLCIKYIFAVEVFLSISNNKISLKTLKGQGLPPIPCYLLLRQSSLVFTITDATLKPKARIKDL